MRYGESNMAFIDKKKVLKTFNEYVNKYDASNVMIVCPSCEKPTRIAHKIVDGKKIRVCKKCGEQLDV